MALASVMQPPADDYVDPRPESKIGRLRTALMYLMEEHENDGALPTSGTAHQSTKGTNRHMCRVVLRVSKRHAQHNNTIVLCCVCSTQATAYPASVGMFWVRAARRGAEISTPSRKNLSPGLPACCSKTPVDRAFLDHRSSPDYLLHVQLSSRNPWYLGAFQGLCTVPREAIYGTVAQEKAAKSMPKARLKLVTPATVNGTVGFNTPPKRRRNADVRTREYLTPGEVDRLIKAAGDNRHGHRDATMILIAYRHGLRPVEAVTLRWEQFDFTHGRMHVTRVKDSAGSVHPLSGRETRALRRLQREQDPVSPFVFVSERGAPFATAGFRKLVARVGTAAGFDFPVHPHMLRHACGYKLANDGVDTRSLQAYLGHRNIQHTVRYAELAPTRFKDFWRD